MTESIAPGSRIQLNFSLSLEDGTVVDSNFGQPPVACRLGDGSLLPGFELRLVGLSAGEQGEWLIPADEAFGQGNPGNIHNIEKSRFGGDADALEPGLVISFAGAGKQEVPGIVVETGETHVRVDFNHPLAGRNIVFRVEIHTVASGPQVLEIH